MIDEEEFVYSLCEDDVNKYDGVCLYILHIDNMYAPILQAINVISDIDLVTSFIDDYNSNNNTSFSMVSTMELFNKVQTDLNMMFGDCKFIHNLDDSRKIIFVNKFEAIGENVLATLFIRR